MYIVTATAPGSTHVNPGQPGKINNQDAIASIRQASGSVIVLCDGCGSQPFSGTGADIGAHVIAREVSKELARCKVPRQINWKNVTEEVKRALHRAVVLFATNGSEAAFEQAVVERFLFTAMVVVIVDNTALVVSFGDGIVVIDDEIIEIEPTILNAPPYLGYLLLKDSAYHTKKLRRELAFFVVEMIDLSKLEKGLIVGTDGLKDLLEEDLHHPALAQPKSLQRWLNTQTTERIQNGSFVSGKCPDDVAMVLVRTDEAQARLVESRREVAELKQEVSKLQGDIAIVNEELERTALARETAEARVAALEKELKPKVKKTAPFSVTASPTKLLLETD